MSVIGYNQPGTLWLPSLIIIHFLITLCSRVQWFRHFFRNSICFMCFWFGLEILRLVYKKAYFEILNSFYLTWPFILQESTPPLIRVEKKCLQHWAYRVSKKRNFALISKMCRSVEFGKREKIVCQHKIPLLLIPCAPNFKEICFQLL